MKRRRNVVLALLALAIVAVLWIAKSSRMPPALPADRTHAEYAGADACLTCHGPEGPVPRRRSHPVGRDCTRCHAGR